MSNDNFNNTLKGNNVYDDENGLFIPGKVSMTEAKIYDWVRNNFGRSEAENPSWNIHELAEYIDDKSETVSMNESSEEIAYECEDEGMAESLMETYK